jgi:hypothetical protein
MKNLANTESRVTQNLSNTDSRVTENSANMENQVMQDSGDRKPEDGKGAAPSKRPTPRGAQGVLQRHRLQKMHQREFAEKKEEEERDYWFNRFWSMTKPKQMWWKNG